LKTAGAGHRLTANDPAIFENVLGPDHPRSAATLSNLAWVLSEQGEFARARPLFNRALTTYEKALGPEHPDTNRVRSNLAALRLAAGCTDRSTCARRESS
jgi:Tfp pilus assembly protein PilF